MADFTVVVAAGAELQRWTDPAGTAGQPSRLRSHPAHPQLYWLGKVGIPIVLEATPFESSPTPPDAALGGRLFAPYLTEGFGPPIFVSAAGYSSVITWTPTSPGHHVVGIRRPQSGAVLVHFDIAA